PPCRCGAAGPPRGCRTRPSTSSRPGGRPTVCASPLLLVHPARGLVVESEFALDLALHLPVQRLRVRALDAVLLGHLLPRQDGEVVRVLLDAVAGLLGGLPHRHAGYVEEAHAAALV